MRRAWTSAARRGPSWYSSRLESHPYSTKMVTSGLLSAAGDLACQQRSSSQDGEWDGLRTLRFAILGAFYIAPVTHAWYGVLHSRLLPGAPTAMRTCQRVAADQLGFAPLFVPTLAGVLWLLEGRSAKSTWEQIRDHAPSMVAANWKLWVPAMAVNFRMVPVNYQVLFGNVVGFFWTVYLSWKTSSIPNDESKGVEEEQ